MINWDPSMTTSSCRGCGCCIEGWEDTCGACEEKSYHEYVKTTFIENQMNCGQCEEEAIDAFHAQPFSTIEKWLIKSGFDLENEYKYLSK